MMDLRAGIPQAGKRWLRGLAFGAGAVLLTAATLNATGDGAVISLSVVPTSGRAQVVIGFNGTVGIKDFTLRNPERIVVDISPANLGLRKSGYDMVARGGVIDVRYGQFKPGIVRVVLTLNGPRHYQVVRGNGAVMVSVEGGGDFVAWRPSNAPAANVASAAPSPKPVAPPVATPAETPAVVTPDPKPIGQEIATPVLPPPSEQAVVPVPASIAAYVPQPPQGERRISITFDKAPIADVLAQFAAFSRRTIIPAKGVTGEITAEIKDKPWDVAMKVILNANGLDAIENEHGIMIVNTMEALAQRPRLEALTTVNVPFNYTSAAAVAEALKGRLTRDCGPAPSPTGTAPAGGASAAAAPTSTLQCPVRGAVTADTLTNSVSITDAPSAIEDIVRYAKTLDIRQPQVNIKAKIIQVDRTQLEGLGLKYDIGSRNQHFNTIVARTDSTGAAETGNVILLGGNTLSAIANATATVPNTALSLVYSAALGAFDFTSFLDAMQETSLLDVQAEPSVTTLNYRTATLTAGTGVPIRTTEQGAGANAAGQLPRVTVRIEEVGIKLFVTPYISNNRQVRMKVHAENSDVSGEGEAAVFPKQVVENELLVADGETSVLAGLTQTSVRVSKRGIPLLVDLPLIGRLFGVTNRSETKRDLLILITPHIVDEGDMAMEPRRQP